MRVFAGDPADPELGAEVTLVDHVEGDALMAPFVRLIGAPGERRIVVGAAHVQPDRIALVVQGAWYETGGWHQETWRPEDLAPALCHPAHPVTDGATTIAKAVAEGSRNTVAELRDLRYEVERQVADLLAQRRSAALRSVLAQLVELSMAFSRARDHAREAVREHRGSAAALRHCQAVDAELGEEVTRLQSLLGSVSTFAVAQEGEVQQRFNTLAAGAAAGLGLPALVLSLYGADDYLPFTWDRAWRALAPIAVALALAGVVIVRRMPGRATAGQYLAAFGLIAGLLAMLLVAGLLAPG
ncbi:hypothetical protein [Nocardia sp. NRRL S-836]|uniref:hypothetical protein n=1 Tax=Nocardia sp. NRRL S-836 TaxID=1519492 RepID=UPI0018D1F63F|nr:hypothetical protein [Nocardia sp. NRRL S-836]